MYFLNIVSFTFRRVHNKLVAAVEMVGHVESAFSDCRIGQALDFGGRAGGALFYTDCFIDTFSEGSGEINVGIGASFVIATLVIIRVSRLENVVILVEDVGAEKSSDDNDGKEAIDPSAGDVCH